MAKSVDLVLKILGDSSGAEKATKAASGSVAKMQRTVSKLTLPAAAVAGAIVAVGAAAVKSASATQQAFGAVDSVFGKSAKQVKAYAKTADQSLGLSASAYANLAAIIGAQLKSAGVPLDQAAAKTQELISRGADLAATFGGTTADAVEALSAALRGEADPAERLGLSLSQTRVNALLAERGQAKLTGTALSAAKAQAVLDLVTKQSAGAIGQFGRETNTAAGSAEIAAAKWENAKSSLGTALLPVVAAATGLLGDMGSTLADNANATSIFVGVLGGLSAAILGLNIALKAYTTLQAANEIVQNALRGSTIATAVGVYAIAAAEWVATVATTAWAAATAVLDALNPFGWVILIVVAIVALVAAIILAYKHSKRFQSIVQGAFAAVRTAVEVVAKVVTAVWGAVWGAISGGVRAFVGAISTAFNSVSSVVVSVARTIATVFGPVFAVIAAGARLYAAVIRLAFTIVYTIARLAAQIILLAFEVVWAYLKLGAGAAARVISAAFSALSGPIRVVAAFLGNVFRAAFNAVRAAAAAMGAFVRGAIAPLIGPARSVANAISSVFRTAFAAVGSAARAVGSVVSSAMSSVRSAFNSVAGVARTIGTAIRNGLAGITGFLDGITSAVQRLIGWLGKIKIPKIKLPGIGSVGASASVAGSRRAAPGFAIAPAAPRLGAPTPALRTAATGWAGGLTVNVFGVLDGADAGRKIRAILRDDDRRRQGVRVAGRTVAA